MDGGAASAQGNAYHYGNAHHGADIQQFRFYEGSAGSIAHGEGNLPHDAYGPQPMDVPYGNAVENDAAAAAAAAAAQGESLDKTRKNNVLRTLPLVLANYIREQNKPISEEELIEQVRKQYNDLRKPDGTKYTGNLERAVRGSLCSTGLFDKLSDSAWTLKESQTQQYERRLLDKAAKIEAEKSKKRKARDDAVGLEDGTGEQRRRYARRGSGTGVRSKRQHKREAIIEMIGNFSENLRNNPQWAACFQNPFKSFRGDEKEDDVWKKLGNDKFVFMLQIHTFLNDLIANRHIVAEAIAKEKAAAKAEKAGKKRLASSEEKGTQGKSKDANTVTPQQLHQIGKVVNNLQESIVKLNGRLQTVEDMFSHGQ